MGRETAVSLHIRIWIPQTDLDEHWVITNDGHPSTAEVEEDDLRRYLVEGKHDNARYVDTVLHRRQHGRYNLLMKVLHEIEQWQLTDDLND